MTKREDGKNEQKNLEGEEKLVKNMEMRYPMTCSSPHLVVFNLG